MSCAKEVLVTTKIVSRFNSKTVRAGPCLNWSGSKNQRGYGWISLSHNTKIKAHRLAWIIAFGNIPEGMWVLHKCDNPSCVLPDHLFLGNRQDNVDDCKSKGRVPKGESHHGAKLTAEKVVQIRLLSGSKPQHMIAEQFGVSQIAVSRVVTGKTWSHIK